MALFKDTPDDAPGIAQWIKGNGYIVKKAAYNLWRYNSAAVLRHVQPRLARIPFGTSPMAKDWDVLLVLDCCRPDALEELSPEYDWLPARVNRTWSPASWSKAWMKKSFSEKYAAEMADTAHITWNPFSEEHLDAADWYLLNEVHLDGGWDDERGLVPPRQVTDRVIDCRRHADARRILAHYQQPHAPYPSIETERLRRNEVKHDSRTSVWDRLIDPDDELGIEDAWAGMLDTLRWVLDDIELLLENLDADRVILTADHGESFNDKGLGLYGHMAGMPLPRLIRVPWVELEATDRNTYTPTHTLGSAAEEPAADVEQRLEQLGYK